MTTTKERPLVRLNKEKDFGTCHPPHEGAVYMQNGFYFYAEGNLCENLLDDVAKKKLAAIKKEREARAAAKAAYDKAMGGEGAKDTSTPVTKPAKTPPAPAPAEDEGEGDDANEDAGDESDDDDIGEEEEGEGDDDGAGEANDPKAKAKADVIAWATGKQRMQVHAIKKLMRENFDADLGSKDAIVQFLVENKIVPEDQVKV